MWVRFKFRGAKMSTQDAKDRQRHRQSGKSMGEFGENYSYRKRYQHDYHDSSGVEWVEPNITPQGKPLYQKGHGNESPSPALKKVLESIPTGRDPLDARKQSQYVPHVVEPYDINRKIKRSDKTSLTKEEIEWRHAELKKRNQWKGLI